MSLSKGLWGTGWRRGLAIASTVIALLTWCNRHFDHRIGTVVADARRYDGKTVKLSGFVANVASGVGKRGTRYTVFDLGDGSGWLTVAVQGGLACGEGSRVSVEGRFFSAEHVGGNEPDNQVDADWVTCQEGLTPSEVLQRLRDGRQSPTGR